MMKSPSITSSSQGAWQAPEEVVAALRERGLRFDALTPGRDSQEAPIPRSIEAIGRFLLLGGGVCAVARFGAARIDGLIAALPGSPSVVAFGADAVDAAAPGGVTPAVAAIFEAAREIGSRTLIYTEAAGVEVSIEGVEIVSLRESVEPFVREALRSHAEACANAWADDSERRLVFAPAQAFGEEIAADEAIERAMAASRRVLVLGDFGSGRSTQLLRRAAAMAVAYLEDRVGRRCPLMLHLRGMRPELGAILREHVPGLSPEAFWLAAELGMVVSIFDSFDELDIRPGETELAAAIKTLTSFAEGGSARVVLSLSRSAMHNLPQGHALIDDRGQALAVVALRGLRRDDAVALVRDALGSDEDAQARARELGAEHDVAALASRPALFQLVALRRRWLSVSRGSEAEVIPLSGSPSRRGIGAAGRAPFIVTPEDPSRPPSSEESPPTTRKSVWPGSMRAALAASVAMEAISRAPIYAVAARDWLRAARMDANEDAAEAVVERGLAAARGLARMLYETGANDAPIDDLEAALAPFGDGRELVRVLLSAPYVMRRRGAARVGFIHPSFVDFFLAEDISLRLDEGQTSALDLPRLTHALIGLLSGIAGWEKRKKKLRDILQQPYRARVSENAILAIHGAARARLEGEALGKKLTEELPSGVKLAGAKLADVSLSWSSLPEADLSGAELSAADFANSDLRGARLDRARADHVTFDGVDLEWATFTGADVFGASFVNANLAGVSLRETVHEGAIRVSARTDGGALITQGVDAPADAPLGWYIESAPHMGQALALSGDGRWIAVARGFTVVILDAVSGHLRMVLPGATSCALAVAFSPDGRYLVSAARDGSMRVWDVRRGILLRRFDIEPSWAIALAVSPDGETLATASDGGPIRVWDMLRGDIIRVLDGRVWWFSSIAYSIGGDLLAAALADGAIGVWDTRRGDRVATIPAPIGPYMCLAFSPHGDAIVSTGADACIRVWDPRKGALAAVLSVEPAAGPMSEDVRRAPDEPRRTAAAPFMAVACSPNGALFAASSGEGGIAVWNARTHELVGVVEGSRDACSLAFSPSSAAIHFTLTDGSIHVADAATLRLVRSYRGHAATVDAAAFSPAGDTVASASSGGSIRVWDARRGDLLHTLQGPAAMGTSIVFSLDGDVLAVVMADGSIRMWDARRGDRLRSMKEYGHRVASLAFSPEGDTLASGAIDGSAAIWDAHAGLLLRRLVGGAARLTSLAFAPEGDLLAAADIEGVIRLWNPRTGEVKGQLRGHRDVVHSIAFLSDGERLASASADGSIRLWDARTLEARTMVEGRTGPVHSIAFSPDGDKLASAHADGMVRLWDAEQGDLLEVLEGHTAGVSSVNFSLDGENLVTASADGTVRLWRVADGRCLSVLLATEVGWVTLVGDAPFFIGGGDISALLRFAAGSSTMPASLWAPLFRRPDLVAKALWGDTPSAAALGLSSVGACEAALLEARARLGFSRGRRSGPTATIPVYKHEGQKAAALAAQSVAHTPGERKFPMKRALTWIHLADLHFGASRAAPQHRFDQEAVMRAIARDVAEISLKQPDFIFVTGDVAWTGQPAEYDEARAWIASTAEASGATLDRVRLVPGNHDVDRALTNTKPVARAHSEIRAAPEELDTELGDAALRALLAEKLAAYADFVKKFPGHPPPCANGIDWSERVAAVQGQRGRARVAGLSTVWVSDGSDGRLHKGQAVPFIRNMILGERQIARVLGDLEEDELLLVLTHHPPEWLHRDSAEELSKALARRTHIHLCSHLHNAPQVPIQKRFGVFGTSVRYVAGSAHGDPSESKKHGYAWGAIRWNGEAAQWQAGYAPRVYDEERQQMRPDASRHKLDSDGFVWEPLRLHWRSPVAVEVQG